MANTGHKKRDIGQIETECLTENFAQKLTVELNEISKIYPMERENFQITIPNDLESGEYSALAIIDYGGARLVAGEIIFEFEKPK